MRSLRSRLFVLLLLLSPFFAACAESSSKEGRDSTAAVGTDEAGVDVEVSDAEWIAGGVPDPDRPWNSEDMTAAHEAISRVSKESGGQLPRYKSPSGGRVFARIVSLENLAFMRNDSISLDERIAQGASLIESYVLVYYQYLTAAMSDDDYSAELTEMMIAVLKMEEELVTVMDQFVASLDDEVRESDFFKSGLAQMQEGIVESLEGSITVLRDDDTFTAAQLEKLANAIGETSPVLLAFLGEEHVRKLSGEADETIAKTDNTVVQDALRESFGQTR